MAINLTDRLTEKIQEERNLFKGQDNTWDKFLRITIRGENTVRNEYSIHVWFDSQHENDLVVERNGQKVLFDPTAASCLDNKTIDYDGSGIIYVIYPK